MSHHLTQPEEIDQAWMDMSVQEKIEEATLPGSTDMARNMSATITLMNRKPNKTQSALNG